MYLPMIDTLIALVDISDYADIACSDLMARIENKKQEAKIASANLDTQKSIISIGQYNFEVKPNGKRCYAYILHNDYYEVDLAAFRSNADNLYPVMIKIKSECLWSMGYDKAWSDIISWVQNYIGNVRKDKLSRIDLCCHTDEISLGYTDLRKFKGQFRERSTYDSKKLLTSMNFGSTSTGKVFCRIYNKTFEVKKFNKKLWFNKIWESKSLNCEKVWNIEFQINRGFLKEKNIESVRDCYSRLQTIWSYCTKEWIVKVNYDRTRIERCSINGKWLKLQSAFNGLGDVSYISREEQLESEASALIPGIIGNITSFAAKQDITDLYETYKAIKRKGYDYLGNKNKTFTGVVNEKKSLLRDKSR